jgi:hypothetical protein
VVYLLPVHLHEPATFLTDLLLAALAGWCASRTPKAPPAARWWRRMLGFTAASAFVGGLYHGFALNFSDSVATGWWIATLWIISLLSAAMALSLVHELIPPAQQKPWRLVILLKLGAFSSAAFVRPEFFIAVVDYGLILLAWLVAALFTRLAWRGWMLTAIVVSVVAAGVQQSGWNPAPHFNHNDVYHVIQAFALIAFYRAGRKLGPAAR